MIDGRLTHPKPYGGHGSVSAYTSCGCRCLDCLAAMREYVRTKKATRKTVQRARRGDRDPVVAPTSAVFYYPGYREINGPATRAASED